MTYQKPISLKRDIVIIEDSVSSAILMKKGRTCLKRDIVIIEDSVAINLLIREFLIKLGYDNVHSCYTGKEGIKVFEDIVRAGSLPLVLLDYNLPDANADNIMSEIYNIRPDAKIILETAEEKQDQVVKEAIRRGIYLYVQKPVRFDDIRDTMKIIEEEDSILKNTLVNSANDIDCYLSHKTVISLARLAEYSNQSSEQLIEYLRNQQSQGKVVPINDITEISCNLCSSVIIEQNFHCPSCKSPDFSQAKLIEHFKCGNITSEDTYDNCTCPKCRKELKIIGVDYRTIDNFYVCKSCKNKFSEPTVEYICDKCNNKFGMEQAKWLTSKAFKVIK